MWTRLVPAVTVAGVFVVVLTGCVPGQPTDEQIASEFDDRIKPAWSVDVPGIYGGMTVEGGLVAVYAQDDEDGLRLEVHDTKTGKLQWEHVASPGGAWGAPLFSETDSASRPYPIPPLTPFVVQRGTGEDAAPVVVFTERVITEQNEIYNPDILHVADLRSGKEVELSAPDFVEFESEYGAAELDADGNLLVQPQSPFRQCGTQKVCFEDNNAGFYVLDLATGEVTNTAPEWDPFADPAPGYSREWGPEYVRIVRDEFDSAQIGRLVDGEEVWVQDPDAIFGDKRTQAAELRDFVEVGDVALVQGYRSILTNTDDGTLEYDYALSRHLSAIDPDTGEPVWQAHGVDMLCYAARNFPVPQKPGVIPVCHATGGSYLFSIDDNRMLKHADAEVSIAGLDLATGELTWEVDGAGTQAVLSHGRELGWTYASGPAFAVADRTPTGDYDDDKSDPSPIVVDLATGDSTEVENPGDGAFLCEAERPGVKLEFQGSVFVGGSNPIALEYPAGFYRYPCDATGEAASGWSKGAVRAGATPLGDGRYIVMTEDGLVGFTL